MRHIMTENENGKLFRRKRRNKYVLIKFRSNTEREGESEKSTV